MDKWAEKQKDKQTESETDNKMNRRIDRHSGGWMAGQNRTEGWMDGQTARWTDGQTNRRMVQLAGTYGSPFKSVSDFQFALQAISRRRESFEQKGQFEH
jgi:hypothetical protein